jgi:hypothetical protein
MSSIEMMSERLDLEKGLVLDHIQKLVEEGKVHGRISSDNSRFFKSDFKVSKAPAIFSSAEEPAIEKTDSGISKYIAISGIILIVSSAISLNLTLGTVFLENFFRTLFMISIVILLAGCIGISMKNPPSNLRP